MEHRISGKYGETKIVYMDGIAKVVATVREKHYSIETNDIEYAFNRFAYFVGKIGANLFPDMLLVEVTRRKKVAAHFCKIFEYDGYGYVVPFKTITPYGREEDVYIPARGVIRRYFIRLNNK